MKAWGSITEKGNILPRSIRASLDEAETAMGKEPLAVMVVKLSVTLDRGWVNAQIGKQ